MIKRYMGLAAVVTLLTVSCSSGTAPTEAMPTQAAAQRDYFIQQPVPIGAPFASFVWPSIWEIVPAGQQTYMGEVEVAIQAMDKKGAVLDEQLYRVKRRQQDTAKEKPLVSELVVILLATGKQMENTVPERWENQRYCIPQDTTHIQVTVDPKRGIPEQNKDNNSMTFFIPESLKGQGSCPPGYKSA